MHRDGSLAMYRFGGRWTLYRYSYDGVEETEEGKIAGAVAIPADEIIERFNEIPKDKKVFVHCSTGLRAEMAYMTLKEKGHAANYLDANITVASSGQYTISEKE